MDDGLMGAAGIARSVNEGRQGAVEMVQAALGRVAALDARVNAFTRVLGGRALEDARALERRLARGERLPLAGVPFAVKNLFDLEGFVTPAGSKVLGDGLPATEDAVLVGRLKLAGAVCVGALNMDEFAYGFTTENSHFGPTRNPHDTARTAGGSSGGCGAAVASGMVPLALGSDTNGSIRVPSSLCGVFGLKPTFGRLPRGGVFPFVASLDHLGPFARCVEDLALAYDACQGPDPSDPSCSRRPAEPASAELSKGTAGLRVARLAGYFDEHAGPAARQAARDAAHALGSADEAELPGAAEARAAAFILTASEGGALHLDRLRRRYDDYEPLSRDRFLAGALIPSAWYLKAQRFRARFREGVRGLLERFDVLIAPATPCEAPLLGAERLDINGRYFPTRPSLGLLTQPVSFAGLPVAAVPVLRPGVLPIGVQVIAAPWREDLALRVARRLEEVGLAGAPIADRE